MHDLGIILRNLDTSAVLMSDSTKEKNLANAMPRISRLKDARIMGLGEYQRDLVGDIMFKAPEVVEGKPYDFKADSWSFGVILFYLLTCAMPYDITCKKYSSMENVTEIKVEPLED